MVAASLVYRLSVTIRFPMLLPMLDGFVKAHRDSLLSINREHRAIAFLVVFFSASQSGKEKRKA